MYMWFDSVKFDNLQTLTIESSLSTDYGNTWEEWKECANNSNDPNITPGDDVRNSKIKYRQNLFVDNLKVPISIDNFNISFNGVSANSFFKFPF